MDWNDYREVTSDWLAVSGRRTPYGREGLCPRCDRATPEILFRVFHPASPAVFGEICSYCYSEICDPTEDVVEVVDAWVNLDLAEPLPVASNAELAMEETVANPLPMVEEVREFSGFQEIDFETLVGQWKASMKGNIFCFQKGFHIVMFPDWKKSGYRIMIDGTIGNFVFPSPARASRGALAAVRDLVSRGVVPRKVLEENGGAPVSTQPELRMA